MGLRHPLPEGLSSQGFILQIENKQELLPQK